MMICTWIKPHAQLPGSLLIELPVRAAELQQIIAFKAGRGLKVTAEASRSTAMPGWAS